MGLEDWTGCLQPAHGAMWVGPVWSFAQRTVAAGNPLLASLQAQSTQRQVTVDATPSSPALCCQAQRPSASDIAVKCPLVAEQPCQ